METLLLATINNRTVTLFKYAVCNVRTYHIAPTWSRLAFEIDLIKDGAERPTEFVKMLLGSIDARLPKRIELCVCLRIEQPIDVFYFLLLRRSPLFVCGIAKDVRLAKLGD